MIIDHLHDDTLALGACSLVCKAWLHSARFHLFYTLAVEDDDDVKELLDETSAAIPYIRAVCPMFISTIAPRRCCAQIQRVCYSPPNPRIDRQRMLYRVSQVRWRLVLM